MSARCPLDLTPELWPFWGCACSVCSPAGTTAWSRRRDCSRAGLGLHGDPQLSVYRVDALPRLRVDALAHSRVDALPRMRVDALAHSRVDALARFRVDALAHSRVDALPTVPLSLPVGSDSSPRPPSG